MPPKPGVSLPAAISIGRCSSLGLSGRNPRIAQGHTVWHTTIDGYAFVSRVARHNARPGMAHHASNYQYSRPETVLSR